jgi:hypothetical protein
MEVVNIAYLAKILFLNFKKYNKLFTKEIDEKWYLFNKKDEGYMLI